MLSAVAGTLVGGRDVGLEATASTDKLYDPERRSVPCILTLSVAEHLQFTKETETITAEDQNEAKQILASYVKQEQLKLLERTKQFVSDTCAICQDGTETPNVVFFACGHQCLHKSCDDISKITRCCLCRAPITARLDAVQATGLI
jgi:hypothetical protein